MLSCLSALFCFKVKSLPHPLNMPLFIGRNDQNSFFTFSVPSQLSAIFSLIMYLIRLQWSLKRKKKIYVRPYIFKVIGINLVKAELTVTNGF